MIFSDEKECNLVEPNCLSYYWHDIKKEKCINLAKQMSDGLEIVWTAFSLKDRSEIVNLHKKQNNDTFCLVLHRYVHSLMNTLF